MVIRINTACYPSIKNQITVPPVFSHRYREVVMPARKDKNATPVLQAFQKHQAALRRFISRFVQRTQDIDDVAQEAFLRAYRAEKGKPIEQPKSFLFRIAHNVAITELTKKSHSDYRLYSGHRRVGCCMVRRLRRRAGHGRRIDRHTLRSSRASTAPMSAGIFNAQSAWHEP